MAEFRATDAQTAQKMCLQLVRDGQADLFRGQTRHWPKLIPSIFRVFGDNRTAAQLKFENFKDWTRSVPQMAVYGDDETSITAIAQHYGIPTTFLDLTTNPEIAILFAKTSANIETSSEAIIYCFREVTLQFTKGARLIRINVDNLWRLEVQEGLFLEYLDEDLAKTLEDQVIRIYFPAESLSAEERMRLYPVRKSALEIAVDQWIYRREIEETVDSVKSSSGIRYTLLTHRETYPGVFRWRSMPEFETSWFENESAWVFPPVESISITDDPETVVLPAVNSSICEELLVKLVAAIQDHIFEHRSTGKLLSFAASLSEEKIHLAGSVSTLINRCWDGLRLLPYEAEELVASISLIAMFLLARAEDVEGVDDWAEQLFGELTIVEVAPIGGHIEAGAIASADLREALANDRLRNMTAHMRRLTLADPEFPMMYIVDPWMLFEFKRFKALFAKQFIPTAVDAYWREDLDLCDGSLGCMWSVSFNPALLGYLTPSTFRFESPIAGEEDCSHIVYILPDMDKADLVEVFVSCMPSILADDGPFRVRFHGYAFDPRPIWEIDRVVEQSKWIVEAGGISVLDVTPLTKAKQSSRDIELIPPAVGAFEIWLISKGMMHETRGKHLKDIGHIFRDFQKDLVVSNANIETRSRMEPDWPGAVRRTQ